MSNDYQTFVNDGFGATVDEPADHVYHTIANLGINRDSIYEVPVTPKHTAINDTVEKYP